MTATATQSAPAAADAPGKGMCLPCPRCGEAEASISLCLADAETFTCGECGTEFTATDLRDIMARWQKVLAWVDAMPSA